MKKPKEKKQTNNQYDKKTRRNRKDKQKAIEKNGQNGIEERKRKEQK